MCLWPQECSAQANSSHGGKIGGDQWSDPIDSPPATALLLPQCSQQSPSNQWKPKEDKKKQKRTIRNGYVSSSPSSCSSRALTPSAMLTTWCFRKNWCHNRTRKDRECVDGSSWSPPSLLQSHKLQWALTSQSHPCSAILSILRVGMGWWSKTEEHAWGWWELGNRLGWGDRTCRRQWTACQCDSTFCRISVLLLLSTLAKALGSRQVLSKYIDTVVLGFCWDVQRFYSCLGAVFSDTNRYMQCIGLTIISPPPASRSADTHSQTITGHPTQTWIRVQLQHSQFRGFCKYLHTVDSLDGGSLPSSSRPYSVHIKGVLVSQKGRKGLVEGAFGKIFEIFKQENKLRGVLRRVSCKARQWT